MSGSVRRYLSSLARSNVAAREAYDLEELIKRSHLKESIHLGTLQHSSSLSPLQGKTILITGASRGIGREIALGATKRGANVALLARSMDVPSHPSLTSTLNDVEMDVLRVQESLPIYDYKPPLLLPMDLSSCDETDLKESVQKTISAFGSIDALILNASAISLLRHPPLQMYDKMMNLNVRSTYGLISSSAPYLLESDIGHVVSISPPLSSLNKKWIHPHPIYTLSKFGMSIVTLGVADPIKANTLWPSKLIKTAATSMIEKSTGIPSFTQGLAADHFVEACLILLQSNHRGSSFLDSDIITIPDGGMEDIFI